MHLCLGIESTAHTFGASVVDFQGDVRSNERELYTTKSGGLIPAKLADHHLACCDRVVKAALKGAGVGIHDIDLVAYSQGPGIGNALAVGHGLARNLSILLKKPLVGVNHCIAHLEIGRKATGLKDPVLLYVSGANTQVIAYDAGRYRIFGETLDIGVGNFLDAFARDLGLGFPGGPQIERLAEKGGHLIELPYVVKGMDISLGGILTNLKKKIANGEKKTDLCFSAQETVFAMLLEVTERAMAHCGKRELILGGGVACNARLQGMARSMCRANKYRCGIPERQFLVDNAAMIAWTGVEMFKAGIKTKPGDPIRPYERTDDVEVAWR
ncbi:MAG: KEOPS complex N(6)-L-threonylcarbamoyladenine synthase Kae1 [Nanoarchaeota archaeon]